MILGNNIAATGDVSSSMADFCTMASLFSILAISSDAIAGYDRDGRIILANENLAILCGLSRQQLLGMDVRSLLLPKSGVPCTGHEWPFTFDGEPHTLYCRRPNDGSMEQVMARAKKVGEEGSFILSVRPVPLLGSLAPQNLGPMAPTIMAPAPLRLAPEPRSKNPDPITLLEGLQSSGVRGSSPMNALLEVLDEIQTILECDVIGLYLSESDGYYLKALGGNKQLPMPSFLPKGGLGALAGIELSTVRFSVVDPASLVGGEGNTVELVCLEDGSHLELERGTLPPLASFAVTPVTLNGTMIALFIEGWIEPHEIKDRECRSLDIFSGHLASEVITSLASIRSRSVEQLESIFLEIRRRLENNEAVTAGDFQEAFTQLAQAMDCTFIRAPKDEKGRQLVGVPGKEYGLLPVDLDTMVAHRREGGVAVVAFHGDSPLSQWLKSVGQPSIGAVVDIDELAGHHRRFLLTRGADREPLEDLELLQLKRFVQDLRTGERGMERREQDNYISQSLQRGMTNHIQSVEGLTAKDVFNSATATASVGGDFYDLIRLPKNRACIILGDVAGKGVQSASVSAAVRTALGAYAWEGLNPAHMVRSLNDFFMGFSRLETFATLFVAVVDLKESTLTYCSAGHPPALLLHPGRHELELLNVQSGVVGAFREMVYKDGHIQLEEGDTLLLYTDGVTEARNPEGEFFGEGGLRACVVDAMGLPVEEIPDHVLSELLDFTENDMGDDVAMLAVRFDRLGANAPEEEKRRPRRAR